MDVFALLGLPRTFELELKDIRRAHLAAVARSHPDAGRDADADALDAAGSVGGEGGDEAGAINMAKQVLMDPERRADVLLVLMGGPSKDADKSLPPGYLMEMMQTREQIDAATTPEAKRHWREWAAQRRAEHIQRVRDLFRRATPHQGSTPQPAVLKDIRLELNAWRYIERLVEQLDGREGDFGG